MTNKELTLSHLNFITEQLTRALDVCTDETVSDSYKVGYSKGTLEIVSDMLADVEVLVNSLPDGRS